MTAREHIRRLRTLSATSAAKRLLRRHRIQAFGETHIGFARRLETATTALVDSSLTRQIALARAAQISSGAIFCKIRAEVIHVEFRHHGMRAPASTIAIATVRGMPAPTLRLNILKMRRRALKEHLNCSGRGGRETVLFMGLTGCGLRTTPIQKSPFL